MILTLVLTVLITEMVPWTDAQVIQPCILNGVTYRHGEVTVEMQDNGLLYRCSCNLALNGRMQRKCNSSREDGHLVIAAINSIGKFALGDAFAFSKPFIKDLPGTVVAVDVNLKKDFIYWTNVGFNSTGIYRAHFSDGTHIVQIISNEVDEPNGVAVDWLTGNVYWTDAQLGAIYVAKDDGRNRARLIGGLSAPRGIVLVPTEGLMFWSDQSRGTIERANMDGTGNTILVNNLIWPNEVVVSPLNRYIFWIDGGTKKIERTDFDASFESYKKIYDFSETGSSAAYGLALLDNRLYFALWNKKKIYSITIEGSDWKVSTEISANYPMGIIIVNTKLQTHLRPSNPCWRESGNMCSHLCLPVSHVNHRCACPSNTGLVLASDQHTCKIPQKFLLCTSLEEGTVLIISLDEGSSQFPQVLVQADQPTAVDFDPIEKMVYWSDVGRNGIYRKHLSARPPELFINDGVEDVDGLAVDWRNRHLYFTNIGWDGRGRWFHRIEIIELIHPYRRKILTSSGLDRPRDISIDSKSGFLYVTDWGKKGKILRFDLDGKNPQQLPLVVENPNGVAHSGKQIYFTDSKYKSTIKRSNGTLIFGKLPSLSHYDALREDFKEIENIPMEIPFGLTYGDGSLFMTDWGLGSIYKIDVGYKKNKKDFQEIAVGIQKPTGVQFARLDPLESEEKNPCESPASSSCSEMCVPVGLEDFTCVCPDLGSTVLSDNQYRCVESDEFLLIADRVRIIQKSLKPADSVYYVIVGGSDYLSNIQAVAYDPENKFIYWADNGRKRIGRKLLEENGKGEEETIFSDIYAVEGMTLDSQQQLLYWTDSIKGTIEVVDVATATFSHATILSNLHEPRAIALNSKEGLVFWTESGLHPGVFSATMSGQDTRQIVNGGIHNPGALFFNSTTDLLWVGDSKNINIQSFAYSGTGSVLDYSDFHGIASSINGIVELGNSYILSDSKKQQVIWSKNFETEILIDDMFRPTQIYLQQVYISPGVSSRCYPESCSHICVPKGPSFACVCPDTLVLDSDLITCISEEKVKRLEVHSGTTTSLPLNTTTAAWANLIITTTAAIFTSTANATTIAATTINSTKNIETTRILTTETNMVETTIATTQPPTTTPSPPYFKDCGGMRYEVVLPETSSKVEVSAKLLDVFAFDGNNKMLKVQIAESDSIELYASRRSQSLILSATDDYQRSITCQVNVTIKDETPPRVVECPKDMNVESFEDDETAFVTWPDVVFEDNSQLKPKIYSNKKPGLFSLGIHNITYTAVDSWDNTQVCSFLISVTKMENLCGKPHQPQNSFLICTSTDSRRKDVRQLCTVICKDRHLMTLDEPQVECEGMNELWLPNLAQNVCREPLPGNVRQNVHFEYPCPCTDTTKYYENQLEQLGKSLKLHSECESEKMKLGFCTDSKSKLRLNCNDETTLEVVITVDLASTKDLKSTEEAKNFVTRSATDLMFQATNGQISVLGTDKEMYSAKSAAVQFSKVEVICPEGNINSTDGCTPCPAGTYLDGNICKFCDLHHYQSRTGQTSCYKCARDRGTTIRGAQHVSNCKLMKRDNEATQVDNNQMIMVIGIVGGIILLIALGLIIYFVIGRMRNNKMKKARREEILRKKQQEIEMRSIRRSTNRNRRTQRPTSVPKPKISKVDKSNEMTRTSSVRRSKKIEKIEIKKSPVDQSEKKDVIKNEMLDDETTVVSVTSLNRAQMKQLQDKKQSNPTERNKKAQADDVSRSGSIRSILKKSDPRQTPRYGSLNRNQMINPAAVHYSGSLRAVRPRVAVPRPVPMRQMGPPRPMFPLGQRRPSLGPHPTIGGYMEDIYRPTIDHRIRYSGYWNRPRDPRHADFRQVPRYMMNNPGLNPQSSLYLQRMRHPYY